MRMDFKASVQNLADKIERLKNEVGTEEATKTSFILPFLNILGYDIFDPTVVVPEFTADIGKKKGEKVDYAIMVDGKPLILIEAKACNEKLDRHATQLERYFTVTDSKFAILTNGIEYRFYSDLEKPNVMDEAPFLTIDMLNLKDRDFKELEKFSSETLNVDSILDMAGTKKYVEGIKEIFKEETKNPSDEMARFFASKLTDKILRQNVIEDFKGYIKQAFLEVTNDLVSDRINSLKSKLAEENESQEGERADEHEDKSDGIVTTNEELEGFFIVKSILAEKVPLNRVAARDTKSYFGILLDDNNRKWIARLHFNTSKKYIGLHIDDKREERFPIDKLEDIYKFKQQLQDVVTRLDSK